MALITDLRRKLREHADPKRAAFHQNYFKTQKGEYGEGDTFIGLTVPVVRKIARTFKEISYADLKKLIASPIHEERLVATEILTDRFSRADKKARETIFQFCIKHLSGFSNWDLIDGGISYIVGTYLFDKKDRSLLETFAHSDNLWKKRIAMLATLEFIRQRKEYDETFRIAKILLYDSHDLIQKAVGWMLREVGIHISPEKEEEFLKKHYKTMPRTMLRYAIEKFPEEKRQMYLKGTLVSTSSSVF